MSDTEIVAVVNSFNRLALLQTSLPSLAAALHDCSPPGAIVVFEAGSTDGSREWLERYRLSAPPVRTDVLPAGDKDNSFSAGVNAGCAYVAAQFPRLKHYFLFETDNWIASAEPLHTAVALSESVDNISAVGFTVQTHAGRRIGYGCPFPTALSFVLGQQMTLRLHLESPTITHWNTFRQSRWHTHDVVYTSPLLVKKEAWEQTGGLDAAAFPFSDCDIDWAWRLARTGWRMAVLEADGVVHDNGQQLSAWSATRVIHFHRARLKLLRRHRGAWVSLLKPLLLARHILECFVLLLTARGTGTLKQSLKKRRILCTSVFHDYRTPAA